MTAEHERYVLPSTDAEAERLERQAQLHGGAQFLVAALAERPAHVLEVGCGTGYFCRHVATDLPEAEVVGVDADASRIAWARAQADGRRPEFHVAELGALPFDDAHFELVFSRFVLVHVTDPVAALREQARVARVGGLVLAYDAIHEGVWFSPPKPGFRRFLARLVELLRARGLEPNQGLHLPLAFERAGLVEIEHRVVPHSIHGSDPLFARYRQNWLETLTGLAASLAGELEPELIDAATRELQRDDEAQLLVELTVSTQGRKP